MPERQTLKIGKRESQGLSLLFLVNPTGDRPNAEEEVATLCTTLPESVTRIILYRQQANQLEMRMRISAETPHVLHYAGPHPIAIGTGEPMLALAGNSRLDGNSVEQLFQSLPRAPLVFLSYHQDERQARNGNTGANLQIQQERDEATERLASNLMTAGASAVVVMRWPISPQRMREFTTLFYQDVADGVMLGEAMRRTKVAMAQHRIDDTSWMSFMLYGSPTLRMVVSSPSNKERSAEPRLDPFDDNQIIPPILPSVNSPDRRFLRSVLELALGEARRMHKDYLGTL